MLSFGVASAQSIWNGSAGDGQFTNGSNWSPMAPGPTETGSVSTSGTLNLTLSASDTIGALETTGSGTIGLNLTSNPLTIAGVSSPALSIDDGTTLTLSGTTAGSVIVQSGQVVLGTTSGGGTLDLNGGTLEVGGADGIVAATGPAIINGGGGMLEVINSSFTTNVELTLASNTRTTINTNGFDASLNGGVMNTAANNGGLTKTGAGNLNFTGTTNTIASFYTTGGNVNQGAGVNVTASEMGIGYAIGNTASYTMSGGNMTLTAGTPPSIVGASASSLRIGDFGGTGTFTQTGGTVIDNGSLNIGNRGSNGLYSISGGTLEIGFNSSINVIGRNAPADGAPGTYSVLGSSHGTLDISGGLVSLASGGSLILSSDQSTTVASVALGSTGTITQTGGTLQIQPGATLYLSSFGNSEYDLNGGTLEVGGAGLAENYTGGGGNGKYTFTLGGGTIQVTGTMGSELTTTVSATLTASTTSTIDTNGLGANISGTFGGSGALSKIGSGALTLSNGNNSFSGGMTVSNGSLLATNATGSAIGTSVLTVASGATVGGPGRVTPNSFTISGTVQVGNGVGVDTNSNFSLLSSAASSLTDATLQFNLNGLTSQANQLHLGTGAVSFASDTLSLNITQWGGALAPLTLIDNASLSDIYSGLSFGGTDSNGNTIITGGLTLGTNAYFGTTVNGVVTSGTAAGSYLFLNTLDGDIGIEVVPEPSTWVMMLGGLVLLFGYRFFYESQVGGHRLAPGLF